MLRIDMRRWVACADHPGSCPPDSPEDGVAADLSSTVTRYVDLDEDLTVVFWPLSDGPNMSDGRALVGSGTDLNELLVTGIDAAYVEWVLDPYGAGASVDDIVKDLIARSADPGFPFARTTQTNTIVFRGPLDTLLPADPVYSLEVQDEWPPGSNGLYNWWTTLEIRAGAPILYIYANLVAG